MAKQTITPLRDRVFVHLITEEGERETDAGIIIPDTAKEESKKVKRGEVVAVGEGTPTDDGDIRPVAVEEGDTVLFTWGDELEIDGEEYYVVNESNILATVS